MPRRPNITQHNTHWEWANNKTNGVSLNLIYILQVSHNNTKIVDILHANTIRLRWVSSSQLRLCMWVCMRFRIFVSTFYTYIRCRCVVYLCEFLRMRICSSFIFKLASSNIYIHFYSNWKNQYFLSTKFCRCGF